MQGELKSLIQLLCRILKENAGIHITPETIRRSKFDDPSTTPQLWKLLHLVLNHHEKELVRSLKDKNNVFTNNISLAEKHENVACFGRKVSEKGGCGGEKYDDEFLVVYVKSL